MKRFSKGWSAMIALIAAGFLSVGCQQNGRPEEQTDSIPVVTFQMCPSSDGVEDFRKRFDEQHTEGEVGRYYNVTPEDISQDYDFSIFKSDLTCFSLLLYNNETYPLGECFGGYGVTSFAVADLNKDGAFELYFTYSWGSGIPRSEVGYFDSASREVVIFDFSNWFGESILETDNDQNLCVFSADWEVESFVDIELSARDKIACIAADGDEISLVSLQEE